MTSATGKQTESPTTLSKADLEELLRREAKYGSPVLSVFLDTDQSREINLERAFGAVLKDMLRVEEVRGLAAESLQEHGNIGAFLRW